MKDLLLDAMARDKLFWTAEGLAEDCWLGKSISDWSELPIGLPVVLAGKGLPTFGGRVDARMEDGSAVWIRDESWVRRLIHRADGYEVRVVVRSSSKPECHQL